MGMLVPLASLFTILLFVPLLISLLIYSNSSFFFFWKKKSLVAAPSLHAKLPSDKITRKE